MKLSILTCVLGGFDTLHDPVKQSIPTDFHRWTDQNFPPITGLTPRLQYRIPKTHGWDMHPGYNYYIWLDGSVTLTSQYCATWYLDQLGDADIGFFTHPDRKTVQEEVEHIEEHLVKYKPYITSRYKNGRHREFFNRIKDNYKDNTLYASTMFIYKNTRQVQEMLADWWYLGSLYFTCDQVQLSYVLDKHKLKVKTFNQHIYQTPYLTMVSYHK